MYMYTKLMQQHTIVAERFNGLTVKELFLTGHSGKSYILKSGQ